jgi:hypothetical protein
MRAGAAGALRVLLVGQGSLTHCVQEQRLWNRCAELMCRQGGAGLLEAHRRRG